MLFRSKKAKKNEQPEGRVGSVSSVNETASSVRETKQQTSDVEKRRAMVRKIIKENAEFFDTDKVGELDGTVKLMAHRQVQKLLVEFKLGANGKKHVLKKKLRNYLGYF